MAAIALIFPLIKLYNEYIKAENEVKEKAKVFPVWQQDNENTPPKYTAKIKTEDHPLEISTGFRDNFTKEDAIQDLIHTVFRRHFHF